MNQKGYTLIEIMIIVAIIGMLAAVAIPQYKRLAERSRASEAGTEYVKKADTRVGKAVEGTHELIALSIKEINVMEKSIEWFTIDDENITFSFRNNQNVNVIAKLKMSKLRYEFGADDPTIKFRWQGSNNTNSMEIIMADYIVYAVLKCKEEVWYAKGLEIDD